MGRRLSIGLLACVLAALPAAAQETRGNINGVVQDQNGVVPGATVRITNTNTSQTQQLVTNNSGYFEALLLNPGTYAVRVELQGFRPLTQTGISLAVGQTLSLSLKLDVGQISEEITVTAEAPLIDTTTVSSGQNFDRRLVEALPMFSNMPIMLSRFTPGVAPAEAEVQNIFQGYMEGTTSAAGGQVGTGSGFDNRNTGNLYTIDGAMNNGFGRRIASSPNADQIEEVRIETSNFDASQGHGTGLTVSMMTRSGTNSLRGSGNYTHWNNQLNSPSLSQKVTFAQDPRQEDAWRSGRSHIAAFTLGGPLSIPKVVDGRGKLFFFANYSKSNDSAPGRLAGTSTVPANRKHLDGDFSDLLLLPSGAGATTPPGHHQYQIYDPLTTRPDPLRPGRVIRDPFPGNIIPRDRFMNPDGTYKNPAFGLYQAMVPAPNQNFLSATQQPVNNYFRAAEPDQPHNTQGSLRIDYNRSEGSRFFVRANGNRFLESSLVDWTYDSPDPQFRGLHDVARARYSWSVTGTWTKVMSASTLLDTQISGNRAYQRDTRKNLVNYTPTSVGLPGYLDEYCEARLECILPQVDFAAPFGVPQYQDFGGVVDGGIWVTTYQGQSNLTSTRGSHTWRGGVDIQWAQRTSRDGAGNMGTFVYDNTYTRAADTTNVFPAQQIGLSLAALMLGMPTSVSIADNNGFDVRNNYFGTFVQDTWRVGRNLTLNLGLRFEYENGIKEVKDRSLLWFDPEAAVSIASIAEAAYAANPVPGMPASQFNVQGGAVYAGAEGYDSRSWKPEALWMPRFSFGYRLGERMAVKGGYGMYYDTLNARDWTPDQEGFDITTTNPLSNDFGRTFLLGNPRAGVLPLVDPFPVRATGSRYEAVLGNALGLDTMLGRGFSAENPNRTHARVQRWRLSWQREIASRTALELAYSGSYADRQSVTIRQDYLPEQYWNSSNFRDTSANEFLTANVPNPFFINNFASFQTTNPQLYQRMLGSTTFTSPTIQRHRLLRAFPHMNNLTYLDQPLGVIKAHTFEAVLTQRYSKGLTGHFAFSTNRVTENRTVEEYDREPTLWQTNNNGRPWRLTGVGLYELPFGPGRAFLEEGGVLSHIARGWSVSGTYEYQPGALLNWGNIFFNGNLDDIKKDKPEIALQPDGTFDPTKTWFNIDAGFVRATADQPAGFQKRVFPFRVDGVRGQSLSMINMGITRTFDLPGPRTFQFRVDIQNLLNRQHYQNPDLNPTSTNFGQVRQVNNTVMRFITFNSTLRF
ncbi:MAG TPA: carboxypeptidase regulatory-like domain-containing protein [Vicinamibacterales bacterium]|nr:carboxypeptidase regulatory-like domain-containing protein [Vicinamibacterales bacterium]